MDQNDWDAWRSARGARKARLLSKLVSDNEALAQYCVQSFAKATNYYTDNMRDDLLQAARIGIIGALTDWEPEKATFSTFAYYRIWHELQQVVRHASGMSVPKSAFLPAHVQAEVAKYEAIHGRSPAPHEVGSTAHAFDRHAKATATFVPLEKQDLERVCEVPANSECEPEVAIDRKRDSAALREFVGRLPKATQKAFWAGKRPDLHKEAKAYVEGKRGR